MPKGIPLTEDYRLEKRLAIAHAAAEMIFQKGYNETSMNQIAQKNGHRQINYL